MVTTNLLVSDGEPKGFQNIARDVTEEKRMQENLRYYLQQITRAQEEERRRIARELHDGTLQMLGSLSLQLDSFIRKEQELKPDEICFLKDIQEQLNRGAQEVQHFSQDLRLSILDDLGLIPALRSLIKSFEKYSEIITELSVLGEERRLSSEVESMLFRIVQEALNNVRKHALATEAQVLIEFTEKRIKVSITDNGRGFELLGGVDDLPRNGKLGLAGIQERARLLAGTFELDSNKGSGTTLTVVVPSETTPL